MATCTFFPFPHPLYPPHECFKHRLRNLDRGVCRFVRRARKRQMLCFDHAPFYYGKTGQGSLVGTGA